MLRVGLTGGLASGKTFVSHALRDLGCFVIHADAIGYEIMAPGGPAYDAIVREFGQGILHPDGEINRHLLSAEVFTDPARLQKLNSIVHPLVIQIEEDRIAAETLRNPHGIAIVEAAILIETGSYKRFDRLILVVCRPEQQVARAMARGLTHQEAMARLSRQMPLEEKRKYADFVIDTSGSEEDTLAQTRFVYSKLNDSKLRP
jgi:dephospho-CoA kinase